MYALVLRINRPSAKQVSVSYSVDAMDAVGANGCQWIVRGWSGLCAKCVLLVLKPAAFDLALSMQQLLPNHTIASPLSTSPLTSRFRSHSYSIVLV